MRLQNLRSQILTLPVSTLLVLVSVARNSLASDSFDASCHAHEKLKGDRQSSGAVLLQLKGASDSSAAKHDAEDGTHAADIARPWDVRVSTDAAQEQLAQYTKLKEVLSQSQELSLVMKNIDEAVDSHLDGDNSEDSRQFVKTGIPMLPKEAQNLDDIIQVNAKSLDDILEEPLPAQGRGDSETSGAENQGLSLLSLDSQEVLAAQNLQGETVSQGLQGMRAWTVEGSRSATRVGKLGDGAAPKRKVAVMEQSAAKVSLKSSRVTLSERGYLTIARLRSNREMEGYVKRVISELSLKIVDPGGLAGVVPFYSGKKTSQSLAALKAELLKTARRRGGWLKKDAHSEHLSLAQTEATQHHIHIHHHHHQHHHPSPSEAPEHVSLLQGASAAVHKVPDLMLGLFGGMGRAVFLLLMALVLGVLYCDQTKQPAGAYENLLDVSPNPKSMKDDMVVASTLKVVQGQMKSGKL